MSSLDPYEERELRRIEEYLTAEDPRLSRRSDELLPALWERAAPTRWPRRVWLAIGIALTAIGAFLPEQESLVAGICALVVAWIRPHVGRRRTDHRPVQHPPRNRP
jgi:hypothetical protein